MGLIRKEDIHESLLNSLSNPNLLINGDFQVWQRGTNFNGANIYTADRWKTNFNATVTNQNGKAHVHANEQYGGLIQFIEFDYIKQFIQGRDISGTIKLNVISGYVTFVVQFIPKSSAPTITKYITVNDGVNSLTLTAPDNLDNYKTFECLVYGDPNAEYEIEYMKVELGSTPTPLIPRLYGEELALCQRYYQIIRFGGYCTHDTSYLPCVVNFPVQMRIVPTFELNYIGQGKNKMDCFGPGIMQFDEMIAFLDTFHLFYLRDEAPVKQMEIGKYYDSFAILDAEIY